MAQLAAKDAVMIVAIIPVLICPPMGAFDGCVVDTWVGANSRPTRTGDWLELKIVLKQALRESLTFDDE